MRGSIFWSESRQSVRENELKFLRHRDNIKKIQGRIYSSMCKKNTF